MYYMPRRLHEDQGKLRTLKHGDKIRVELVQWEEEDGPGKKPTGKSRYRRSFRWRTVRMRNKTQPYVRIQGRPCLVYVDVGGDLACAVINAKDPMEYDRILKWLTVQIHADPVVGMPDVLPKTEKALRWPLQFPLPFDSH